jgi:hypothetical protein
MKQQWKKVFKLVKKKYGYGESYVIYRYKNSPEFHYLFQG